MSNTRRPTAADVLQHVLENDGDYYETDEDSDNNSDSIHVQSNTDNRNDTLEDLLAAANRSDNDAENGEIHSDHDTNSEQLANVSDEEREDEVIGELIFYGKDTSVWFKKPVISRRTPSHNIVTSVPGLKGPAQTSPPQSPLDSCKLIITENMLDKILVHTNQKILKTRLRYQKFTRRSVPRTSKREDIKTIFCNKNEY